jgi:hypothetical protein
MKTVTIGARISEELDRDLAKTVGGYRPLEIVARGRCLDQLRPIGKAFIEGVEEGIRAAEEGHLFDHDAVVAEFERRYRSR